MTLILSGTDGLSDVDGSAATPAIRGTDANTGIFFGTDIIGFSEGGVEAMRIDASGNVGIGTTSPSYKLHVVNAAGGDTIVLDNGGGAGDGASTYLAFSGTNTGANFVRGRIRGAFPDATGGGLAFETGASGSMSERMRITSGGDLLVGTTSVIASAILTVVSSAANNIAYIRNSNASPYGLRVNYSTATPNNTDNWFYYADDATAQRFLVRSNGGIANYSANNVNLSDRREKTNFAPATSYLDKICAIPVQTFNYIDQNLEQDGGLTLGVVAQDVQAVAPELVMESDWAKEGDDPKMRLSIYQTDLQYALMKCIQEQQALITQLQADVTALKGQP